MQWEQTERKPLFPHLRPITHTPLLWSIQGTGLRLLGARGHHPESQSCTKTHCFCFFYFPILALASYRVIQTSPQNWTFLGKEPLSALAKSWNLLLFLGLLFFGGWTFFRTSSELSQDPVVQLLTKANHLKQRQKFAKAIPLYLQILKSQTIHMLSAKQALRSIYEKQSQLKVSKQANLLIAFTRLPSTLQQDLAPNLLSKGTRWAHKHQQNHPEQTIQLLQALLKVTTGKKAKRQKRLWLKGLLKKNIKQRPNRIELISQLAELYEKVENCRSCEELLAPHEKKLRDLEGARILGLIYARKHKLQRSNQLLMPYVTAHIKKLRSAEKQYQEIVKKVRQEIISQLKQGVGHTQFHTHKFLHQPAAERKKQLIAYIQRQTERHLFVQQAKRKLILVTRFVPVVLELGLVKLERARMLFSATQRQMELQAIANIFLAIRSIAGTHTQYKLSLGHVYYWLGKQRYAKKLFREVLEKSNRSVDDLTKIAAILREVGHRQQATLHAEEAYNKATSLKTKHKAAMIRALSSIHLSQKILWLKRADLSRPEVSALLHKAEGNRFHIQGQKRQAANSYRKAIQRYKKLAQTPSSLNNCALSYFSLFQVTGKNQAFHQGIQLLEKAVQMKPGDGILLFNAADSILQAIILELSQPILNLQKLPLPIDLQIFPYLYKSQRERQLLHHKFSHAAALSKAILLLKKVLLLMPNHLFAYELLSQTYVLTKNQKGLKQLLRQLRKVRIVKDERVQSPIVKFQESVKTLYQKHFTKEAKRQETLLQSLPSKNHRHRAITLTKWTHAKLSAAMFGTTVPNQLLIQRAKKALSLSPCQQTHWTWLQTRLFQTSQQLLQTYPAYRQLLGKSRHILPAPYAIAMALTKKGRMFKRIKKHPNMRKILRDVRRFWYRYKPFRPIFWALLSKAYPNMRKTLFQHLKQNKRHHFYRKIRFQLYPEDAKNILELYWYYLAFGQKQEAIILQQRTQSIPLPFSNRKK